MKKEQKKYGNEFLRHISHVKDAKNIQINFIAHSLGAILIFHALTNNDWGKYNINNVIFFGGAAYVKSKNWPILLENINGKLINAYSKNDRILQYATPDTIVRVGRNKINYDSDKISNRRYYFGHNGYWERLDYLLKRLWVGYEKSKSY